MLKRTMYAVILLALVAGCPGPKPPMPLADCDGACASAEKLHCELAKPTKKGGSCLDVCRNADNNGFPWGTACMSVSKTCDELENCQ